MNYLLFAIIALYLIGFWLMLRSDNAPKIEHDWFEFVEKSSYRELGMKDENNGY